MRALLTFSVLFLTTLSHLKADISDTGNAVKQSFNRLMASCTDELDELGRANDGHTLNLSPLPYMRRLKGNDFNLENPKSLAYPDGQLQILLSSGRKLVSSQDRVGSFSVTSTEVNPDIYDSHGRYWYTWSYAVPALRFNFAQARERPRSTLDISFLPYSHGVAFRHFPKIEAISFSKQANLLVASIHDSGTDTNQSFFSTVYIYDMASIRAGNVDALQKIGGQEVSWLKISSDGKYIFGAYNAYGHKIFLFQRNSESQFVELDLTSYNQALNRHRKSNDLNLNFLNATVSRKSKRHILDIVLSLREGDNEYKFYRMPIDIKNLQVLKK